MAEAERRASEVPRRAWNTISSGLRLSKANPSKGERGIGGRAASVLESFLRLGLASESRRLFLRLLSPPSASLSSKGARGSLLTSNEAKAEGDARERVAFGANISRSGSGSMDSGSGSGSGSTLL